MASLIGNLLAFAIAAQSTAPATGRIVGRVVDAATREPISGAVVSLVSAQITDGRGNLVPPPPNLPVPRSPLVSQTNFEGTFEIGNVPQGRWRLQVQREGYVLLSGLSAAVPIESTGGRVTVPDVALDRGGTVTGRVLDARGRPVVGVMVLAMRPVTAPDGTARTTGSGSGAETDDLGEFRVPGLAPGRHYIVAQPRPNVPLALLGSSSPPATTAYVPTYFPGVADLTLASPVDVVRGGTTSAIDFSMLSVPAYQVSGIVIDAAGRPVANARVQLTQQPRGIGVINQVTSAADGTFRMLNIPSGTYMARAAIPVVARSGNAVATATNFGPPNVPGIEVIVPGADVSGVRIVASGP